MRVLVLGASGSIGNAVVRELVAHGHELTGSARAASCPLNLRDVSIRYCGGDTSADGVLAELCRGQDVVVDAATPYTLNLLTAATEADRRPIDVAVSRVEALLDALRTHGPRLVHVSSAHADGKRRSSAVWKAQQKLFRSVHPYFAIKQQTEARIRAAMAAGLEATIVRPTACLGPWDIKRREDCWIPKLIAGEVPGILSHRLNIIDTRDLAIAVRAAVEGECIGETMLLAGHNTTTEHLVAQLCDAAGVVAPRLRMPAELSVLPLLWIETLWATVGSASPLPSLVPALLCEQEWVDQSRAANRLGVRPRPLQTTAHDTVAWYQSMAYC